NDRLGNAGKTVAYTEPVLAGPDGGAAALARLAEEMRDGKVSTLVIVGGNPVYTAPADVRFSEAMEKVPLRLRLRPYRDQTSPGPSRKRTRSGPGATRAPTTERPRSSSRSSFRSTAESRRTSSSRRSPSLRTRRATTWSRNSGSRISRAPAATSTPRGARRSTT